ncbi:MAG TPA: hypothetical protein VNV43_15325 [Candidatus Acidoferrales bacterium]|jgi:hypothetical protein|nr:hypothetical protein [Candidatus Acidoferrales bacterium]
MDILNLTPAQLKHAADIKEQIAALEDELQSIVRGGIGNGAPSPSRTRRNRMSAAGRARIIAAQKARWAKFKKSNGRAVPRTKSRKFSAAARAKIAAAARARWAKAKASGKNSL